MVLSRGLSRRYPRIARPGRNYLKKKENFTPSYYRASGGLQIVRVGNVTHVWAPMAPLGHTSGFSGSRQVQSGTGDVIKGQYGAEWAGFEKEFR
jgi:hypothetical protein